MKAVVYFPCTHAVLINHYYICVCCALLKGRPCKLKWDPDYVPSIFVFKESNKAANKNKLARSQRLEKRRRNNSPSQVCRQSQKCRRMELENCDHVETLNNTEGNNIMNNDDDIGMESDEPHNNEFCSELYQPKRLSELADDHLKC